MDLSGTSLDISGPFLDISGPFSSLTRIPLPVREQAGWLCHAGTGQEQLDWIQVLVDPCRIPPPAPSFLSPWKYGIASPCCNSSLGMGHCWSKVLHSILGTHSPCPFPSALPAAAGVGSGGLGNAGREMGDEPKAPSGGAEGGGDS